MSVKMQNTAMAGELRRAGEHKIGVLREVARDGRGQEKTRVQGEDGEGKARVEDTTDAGMR